MKKLLDKLNQNWIRSKKVICYFHHARTSFSKRLESLFTRKSAEICSNIQCMSQKNSVKKQLHDCGKHSEANKMNNSLDKELVVKAIENSVQKIIHEQINKFKIEIEATLTKNLLSAKATDDLRDIQCIIFEAKKIEDNNGINTYTKIELIFNKVNEAILKIELFQKEYKTAEKIPSELIDDLINLNDSCKINASFLAEELQFIQRAIDSINNLNTNLNKDSNLKTLKKWAQTIEIIAEAIEVCFKHFPKTPLGIFEDFANTLISKTSEVSYKNTQKESLRRRLRYASIFILNLVKKERLNRSTSCGAEIKALTRIKEENIEWIFDSEQDEHINIEEISNFF